MQSQTADFAEIWTYGFGDMQVERQTDLQTDRHADGNTRPDSSKTLALYKPFTYLLTFHPYRGRSIDQLLMMMK